ncbi:MAG TPA: DUF1501 domain-containing protein [Bacteroidia bacterium]|nr:DUF1501 domain-containing protein [Bacteroidia bacterium]
MSTINRKKFIQLSALASGALLMPKFLKGLNSHANFSNENNERVLVVIQLSGGNDGLNTFIPFKNDSYYQLRGNLAIPVNSILKVDSEMGFNPGMTAMKHLYDSGDLCIINNVGYPNPDHSHFRSMDIWTTASGSDQYFETGWLGRYLDSSCIGCDNAHMAIEVDETLGKAMKGLHVKGLAINNPERLYKASRDPFFREMMEIKNESSVVTDNSDYLYKTLVETSSSISYIYNKHKIFNSTEVYPTTAFGKNMKLIAELICSGSETKIYYVSLTGFDTHARQQPIQEKLLKIVSEGLNAMIRDLKKNDRFNNTLIMAFSEFGRRVKPNGSQGTDHGEGNSMLLASGALKKKGFFNALPDLEKLSDGNLQFKTDFRSVYATVLRNWMKTDDTKIIGKEFEILDFI